MGWAVGYDPNWQRDIGYGVPSICDHPGCDAQIDRGLGYVCGGDVYGGEHGCGLFFCGAHSYHVRNTDLPDGEVWSPCICERCADGFAMLGSDGEYKEDPPEPRSSTFTPKPDLEHWNKHKVNCPSWQAWRDENPEFVVKHKELVDLDYDPEQY